MQACRKRPTSDRCDGGGLSARQEHPDAGVLLEASAVGWRHVPRRDGALRFDFESLQEVAGDLCLLFGDQSKVEERNPLHRQPVLVPLKVVDVEVLGEDQFPNESRESGLDRSYRGTFP